MLPEQHFARDDRNLRVLASLLLLTARLEDADGRCRGTEPPISLSPHAGAGTTFP